MARIVNDVEIIDMDSVKAASKRSRYPHYFEASEMAFWGTRLYPSLPIWGGRYFVTGDPNIDGDDMRFSVRELLDDGTINTSSEFREYSTRLQANWAAQSMAEYVSKF